MKKNILLFTSILSVAFGFSQNGSTVATANLLCGTLAQTFNLTSGVANGETGPNYGCLPASKNPTWFYIPISQSGNVNLKMTGNSNNVFTGVPLDIDFVSYGPFANISEITPQNMTGPIVDCSYDANTFEILNIPNAISGQIYVVMISKFADQAGFVKFEYGPSTGQINCSGLGTMQFDMNTVSVFPNPAKNNINVTFDNGIISEISIFNILGQNVLTQTDIKTASAAIDISKLEKGTYILSARNENGAAINKQLIIE